MKVEPINQGQHYRPLNQRLAEIASAMGMEEVSVNVSGISIAKVVVLHPVTRARYEWNGTIEGRSDDDVVKQFAQWVASVR